MKCVFDSKRIEMGESHTYIAEEKSGKSVRICGETGCICYHNIPDREWHDKD